MAALPILCHLLPICWQRLPFAAILLAAPANPVAAPASDHLNPLKTNDVFYLMTFRLSKGNIMQLKQSLRAVCSELRDVCTKMRTKGPSFLIPFINGSQAQAGIPAYAMRAIPPFKVVLTSMVLVAPVGAAAFEITQEAIVYMFALLNG